MRSGIGLRGFRSRRNGAVVAESAVCFDKADAPARKRRSRSEQKSAAGANGLWIARIGQAFAATLGAPVTDGQAQARVRMSTALTPKRSGAAEGVGEGRRPTPVQIDDSGRRWPFSDLQSFERFAAAPARVGARPVVGGRRSAVALAMRASPREPVPVSIRAQSRRDGSVCNTRRRRPCRSVAR